MKEPKHPLLAQGKVRHVGDQVAVVVADTLDAGEGRRRADRGRLRGAARGGRRARRDEERRARRARRGARQHLLRVGARRQGRGRCRVRQGRARDDARVHQQPPDPERHRAARLQRVVHARRRVLHALRRQPEPARRAAADDGVRAGPARAQGARDRARRGRRLRLQDLPLRRGDGVRLGLASSSAARSSGPRSAREIVPRPTRTAATTSPRPSSPSTRTASSSRCA